MYIPKAFASSDDARARRVIERHPFGALIAARDGELEIAHLPFLMGDGEPFALRAHVARANPFAKLLDASPRVTAVFQGPHAYVTPRWYESPTKQVPTWNYAVVHVHGVARAIDDEAGARAVVAALSARFEPAIEPWTADAMDGRLLADLLRAIRAFRVEVTRVETKLKLSQNRSDSDRRRVIAGLRQRAEGDDLALAALMDSLDE